MSSPFAAVNLPDLGSQSFPFLTAEQIARVRGCGELRSVQAGEILFEPGDTNVPFFVVVSGCMDIVQPSLDGERAIASHEPGQFTGEISMISGQQCLVLGRMAEAGELIEVSSGALRSIVAKDAELSEILMRAFILRRVQLISHGFGNVILMGSRHSAQTLQLREFLSRNGQPFTYVDLDTDQTSQSLLDRFDVKASDVPVVICRGQNVLRSPTTQQLASCLGLNHEIDGDLVRDVVIVGAGPAGLAAAVYAASEGLNVVVVETQAPGGQAGSSSKIENYLGFPTGVSGQELAARATSQAQKFGAELVIARSVVRLDCGTSPYKLVLDADGAMHARSVVIATGAHYNKPQLPNVEKFEGNGIYYGATYIEAQLCGGDEVVVVGGGNSAGQAAVFLSRTARKLYMLVRSGELSSSMSRYLIQRLVDNPQIELHLNSEITALDGDDRLERVTWQNKSTGEQTSHALGHVFIMAGASPRTEWLQGCLALDDKGFILTGRDLETPAADGGNPHWPLSRTPQMLETSLPGVFAVGDVRSGNVKRVASAVGEGAIAIHMVHKALAEL